MPNVLTVGCPSVFGRISNLGNGREGLSVRENRFDIRVRLDTDSVLVRLSGQWLELIFVSIRQVACVYWQG